MTPLRTPILDDLVGGTHHDGEVLSCAFAPGPLWAASSGRDGQVLQWDLNVGLARAWWRADERPVTACAISPDGTQLWTGAESGALAQWDAASHSLLGRFVAHARPISGVSFSPDGQSLATTSSDGSIVLRAAAWPQNGKILMGHRDAVAGARFTPDGQRILSWSNDRTMTLWDVATAQAISVFSGHEDRLSGCDVSPNGQWFATASRDGVLVLWEASEGRQVAHHAQEEELRACFFTPDGDLLLTLWANGDLLGHSVPDFDIRVEQATGTRPNCGAVFCMGAPLAIGAADGRLHFLTPPGLSTGPLWITAIEVEQQLPAAGLMSRLRQKSEVQRILWCTCPMCHFVFTLPTQPPSSSGNRAPVQCPSCRRALRLNSFTFPPPPSWQAQFRPANA